MDQHLPPRETKQPTKPPPKPEDARRSVMSSDYTQIRENPGDDEQKPIGYLIKPSEFDELTEKAQQLGLLLAERKAFIEVFKAIAAMPDHWAPTMKMYARVVVIASDGQQNLAKLKES